MRPAFNGAQGAIAAGVAGEHFLWAQSHHFPVTPLADRATHADMFQSRLPIGTGMGSVNLWVQRLHFFREFACSFDD
jgi:hypothetical protein